MNDVYFIGDTHGNTTAIRHFLDRDIADEDFLIHVGDFGAISKNQFGLNVSKFIKSMDKLDMMLKKCFNKLYIIRGNHDDPVCFDGRWGAERWSNIEFLPDYSTKEIGGKKFLFVGGAISVDRLRSIRENGAYWWDEEVKFDESKIQKCDVLVTHTADSLSLGMDWSNIDGWIFGWNGQKGDPNLIKDLTEEGQKMLKIRELCQPDHWFCGHYHNSISTNIENTRIRVLDINEIYEYRYKI